MTSSSPHVLPGDCTNAFSPPPGSPSSSGAAPRSYYRGAWERLVYDRGVSEFTAPVDPAAGGSLARGGPGAGLEQVVGEFFSALRRADGDAPPLPGADGWAGALRALAGGHEAEPDFSRALFGAVKGAVRAALPRGEAAAPGGAGWKVAVDSETRLVLAASPALVVGSAELGMGLVREQHPGRDLESTDRSDHAWAVFERAAAPPSIAAGLAGPSSKGGGAATKGGLKRDESSPVASDAAGAAAGGGGDGAVPRAGPGEERAGPPKKRRSARLAAAAPAATASRGVPRAGDERAAEAEGSAAPSSAKKEDEWRVRHILAVVELKMQDHGCEAFAPVAGEPSWRKVATEGLGHGPIAQVILYNLAHVLRGRAALGLPLPEKIPSAVIVGRQAGKDSSTELAGAESEKPQADPSAPSATAAGRNSWALVHLATPAECGGRYTFGLDAHGTLFDDKCAERSLAAYLHVMAGGVRAASEWLKRIQSVSAPPSLISGRALYFGGTQLPDPIVLASPVGPDTGNGYKTLWSDLGDFGYRITQGELAMASINLKLLKLQEPSRGGVLWLQPDGTEYADAEEDILIKVTSVACFNMLVSKATSILFDRELLTVKDVAKKLYPSLHGIYKTPYDSGIVQLLPNLYAQGFRPLRPEALLRETGMSWTKLWDAFEHFVLDTLITLAGSRIVHPDIRPGYDETANLLYDNKEIRMIDLDSLCTFNGWRAMEGLLQEIPRYIKTKELAPLVEGTLSFVFWQVILVAQVWLGKIRNKDVHANELLKQSGKLPTESDNVVSVDRGSIEGLLQEYRNAFAELDRAP